MIILKNFSTGMVICLASFRSGYSMDK